MTIPKFQDLLYSKPLDIHKSSKHGLVSDCIDNLLEELKRKGVVKNITKPTKRALTTVILDLFITHQINARVYTAYSRNNNSYNSGSRYNSLNIKRQPLFKVVDGLETLGYVAQYKGWIDKAAGKKYQTRIKATQKLIDFIHCHRIEAYMVESSGELIILKDKNKKEVDYTDTPNTIQMRKSVECINSHLGKFTINLHLSDEDWRHLLKNPDLNFSGIDIISRNSLYRVFNNSSFDQGGRFYGGWWQSIPKDYRKYITIDSKRTVEYDYSAIHPRLLYASIGITYSDDPYNVPYLNGKIDRGTVKVIFNTMLNANSRSQAIKAMRKYKIKESEAERYLDAIENFHPKIKHLFYSDKGSQLQNLDSRIAEKVMLRMIDKYPFCSVLPVHDSFIVKSGYFDVLEEEMKEAIKEEAEAVKAVIENKERKDILNQDGQGEIDISDWYKHCSEFSKYHYWEEQLEKQVSLRSGTDKHE